jgi:hypothetical protein
MPSGLSFPSCRTPRLLSYSRNAERLEISTPSWVTKGLMSDIT